MNDWFQHIITALDGENISGNLPLKSSFGGILLPDHNLILHFISIDQVIFNRPDQAYFATISDEAKHHGLKCIHIWEDVYQQDPELVLARTLALIGNRKRIHGRATHVVRIDKKTADDFLNKNHLQKAVSAYYKFGLYKKDLLVSVATFSKSRIMQDGAVPYRSYELIRFASEGGVTVTGGLSKLLTAFIREVNPAHIMTYADRDWGSGEGYEKLGFTIAETIPPVPLLIHLPTFHRYTHTQLATRSIPDSELLPIFNSGSYKYILDRRTDHTS
jgi:hypothetical protein